MNKFTISDVQMTALSNAAAKKRVKERIGLLCEKHGESEIDQKVRIAYRCYKNAVYYGITGRQWIDAYIEIGFFHPELGSELPLREEIHEHLVSYCGSVEIQIDYLMDCYNHFLEEI